MVQYSSLKDMTISYSGVHNNVSIYNKIDDICKIVGINFYKYAIDHDGLSDLYATIKEKIHNNLVESLETSEKKFWEKREQATIKEKIHYNLVESLKTSERKFWESSDEVSKTESNKVNMDILTKFYNIESKEWNADFHKVMVELTKLNNHPDKDELLKKMEDMLILERAKVLSEILNTERRNRDGDPIRGDLPFVPYNGDWFRLQPNIELRDGVIQVVKSNEISYFNLVIPQFLAYSSHIISSKDAFRDFYRDYGILRTIQVVHDTNKAVDVATLAKIATDLRRYISVQTFREFINRYCNGVKPDWIPENLLESK